MLKKSVFSGSSKIVFLSLLFICYLLFLSVYWLILFGTLKNLK